MSQPKLLAISPDSIISFDSANFSQPQTKKLVLENISKDQNVAFKVKTTQLKAYLVRPSSAVLKPGEKKDVAIMLQRMNDKPKNHDHRFLVQAVPTTQTEISSKEEWNKILEMGNKAQEFRLSVVFPDSGQSLTGNSQYDGSKDLQSKYEELAAYTQKLETQKKLFEDDLQKFHAQNAGGKKKGYQLWQIFAAVILALFVAKNWNVFRR